MTEPDLSTVSAPAPSVVPPVSYPLDLPISRKAYRGFIGRIYEVYSAEQAVARLMVSVLDVYLLGDRQLADAMLDGSDHRHAFSFLSQDVDMAIERSRRARQQALARRLARQQLKAIVPPASASAITSGTSPVSIPLTPSTPTASTSAPSVSSASSVSPASSHACPLSIPPVVESPAPLSLPATESSADIVVSPSAPVPMPPSASSTTNNTVNLPDETCPGHTKAESAILSGQEIGGHEVWSGRRVNDFSRIPMFSSLLNPVVNSLARTRAERRAEEQSLKRKLKSRNRPLT